MPDKSKVDGAFSPLIDTREQAPLDIENASVCTLKTGDYSCCLRHATSVTIERKSATDILGCIGHSRRRFERELERLRDYRFRAIVIEDSMSAILTCPRSSIHESAVLGSLAAWSWRYSLPIWLASNRVIAAKLVTKLLRKGHEAMEETPAALPTTETITSIEAAEAALGVCTKLMWEVPDFVPLEPFYAYITAVNQRKDSLRLEEVSR